MNYKLEFSFKDKPECINCMLGRYIKKDLDGNSIMCCCALGSTPKCPDEGCRNDCPLKVIE